ncbi:hypothetical protein D8682_06725 [Buttiauxella sp. 3AFRM03]|nr:hypothetical protein D8682_06725 [Buttiauxella sp. 3AFRM03]
MQPLTASLKIRGANVDDLAAIGFRPFVSTGLLFAKVTRGLAGSQASKTRLKGSYRDPPLTRPEALGVRINQLQ